DVLGGAAAKNPDDATLHAMLGRALFETGRLAEAAVALERALAKKHDDSALFELLSAAQVRQGRFEAAAAAYQRVIDLGRRDSSAYLHLGSLFEQASQHESAWHAYHHAFKGDDRNVEIIGRLAATTDARGRTHEAIQWLRLAVGIAPRDAALRYALARCHLRLEQRAEALGEYEIVCQLDRELATQLYHALGGR
ncbi:MAG: tetratricopeptide repeat protein, partial [Polyangiales bacterium]